MKTSKKVKKRRSILFKVFSILMGLTLSIILFILAFWSLLVNKPNQLYAHIHLAITLIILVIVGSMVASHIIRGILKPLSKLNEAVDKISQGNLDQQIPVITNDEIGTLTEAFNHMTEDIKKMIAAREQLLLDVSHELRSPITRAKLALEMMPDTAEKESLAGDLKEMEIMITEILESERLKNGIIKLNLTSLKVADLLQKLMENYQRESGRIVFLPVASYITITADETLIMTVLRNLIDNSLKYSCSDSKPVEISVIKGNEKVTIQIEDDGPGIPEDKLPYIFEPFYRVDQSRSRKTGGYGLGLHLCKRIMDLHGAEIGLKNKTEQQGVITTLIFNK